MCFRGDEERIRNCRLVHDTVRTDANVFQIFKHRTTSKAPHIKSVSDEMCGAFCVFYALRFALGFSGNNVSDD